MADEASYDIYARQLFGRRHGYPLWHPESDERGPIEIGDVGHIMHGKFCPLFNVTFPEDDDIHNLFGVPNPSAYKPFVVSHLLKVPYKAVIKDALWSKSVQNLDVGGGVSTDLAPVGAGLKFQCNKEQGAFAVIDQPADRSMIAPPKSLAQYIKMNIESWSQFASERDLDISPTDFLFVSGTVKTNDWAIGAFLSNGHSCEAYVQMSPGCAGQVSFNVKKMKSSYANTDYRTRSDVDPIVENGDTHSPSPAIMGGEVSAVGRPSLDSGSNMRSRLTKDQCLFINYYKVKKRLWGVKVMKAAAGPDQRDHDRNDEGEDCSVIGSDNDELELEQVPGNSNYCPVEYLLDYILDYVMEDGTQVQVAIASDAHLYALFDEEVPDDIPAALERLRPPVMFLDDDRELGSLACAEWSEESSQRESQLDRECVQGTRDEGVRVGDRSEGEHDSFQDDTQNKNTRPVLDYDGYAMQPVVLQEPTGGVTCVAFSPDGLYIASGSEDTNIILRDGSGTLVARLMNHHDTICTLAFSPDSKRLASGSSDGLALIWDVDTRTLAAVLDGHDSVVGTISYSPDASKIVTSSVDFSVRVWDATTGGLLHTMVDHKSVVLSAIFSPDGRWIASCGADYKAKIWDAHTGALHRSLEDHTGVVWSIAFSPDSRRVITASEDTTCRIWDVETGEVHVILREHHGPVWCVAFSPDGKQAMSVSNDATIKICDSFSGECAHAFDRHDTVVNVAVFSPDGIYVASSANNHAVMVWNTKTGKSLPPMLGHVDKVTGLQFSPESDRLVSCSDDGSVRIWPLPMLVEGETD